MSTGVCRLRSRKIHPFHRLEQPQCNQSNTFSTRTQAYGLLHWQQHSCTSGAGSSRAARRPTASAGRDMGQACGKGAAHRGCSRQRTLLLPAMQPSPDHQVATRSLVMLMSSTQASRVVERSQTARSRQEQCKDTAQSPAAAVATKQQSLRHMQRAAELAPLSTRRAHAQKVSAG